METTTIKLDLAERGCDIVVNHDWLDQIGVFLQKQQINFDYTMVFTSPRVGEHYFRRLRSSLIGAGAKTVCCHHIPDGEENKTMEEYQKCLDALLTSFSEPSVTPLVINLGGGVVGDIGGFAAATYRRGIPYMQVPTTLLGLVDCGVGGKLGVNYNGIKNIIGTIQQSKLVFMDYDVLQTLDARQVRSGVAEIIKYGVTLDPELFDYLQANIEELMACKNEPLSYVVPSCLRLKANVVQQDELDNRNIRAVLNFGHTFGHGIEMAARLQLTHGEAISIGMLAATRLGIEIGRSTEEIYRKLEGLIKRAGLPTHITDTGFEKGAIDTYEVFESMRHDKKNTSDGSRFIFVRAIGDWEVHTISDSNLICSVLQRFLC